MQLFFYGSIIGWLFTILACGIIVNKKVFHKYSWAVAIFFGLLITVINGFGIYLAYITN